MQSIFSHTLVHTLALTHTHTQPLPGAAAGASGKQQFPFCWSFKWVRPAKKQNKQNKTQGQIKKKTYTRHINTKKQTQTLLFVWILWD